MAIGKTAEQENGGARSTGGTRGWQAGAVATPTL